MEPSTGALDLGSPAGPTTRGASGTDAGSKCTRLFLPEGSEASSLVFRSIEIFWLRGAPPTARAGVHGSAQQRPPNPHICAQPQPHPRLPAEPVTCGRTSPSRPLGLATPISPSSQRRRVRLRSGIWCFPLPGTERVLCGTGPVTGHATPSLTLALTLPVQGGESVPRTRASRLRAVRNCPCIARPAESPQPGSPSSPEGPGGRRPSGSSRRPPSWPSCDLPLHPARLSHHRPCSRRVHLSVRPSCPERRGLFVAAPCRQARARASPASPQTQAGRRAGPRDTARPHQPPGPPLLCSICDPTAFRSGWQNKRGRLWWNRWEPRH